MTLRLRLFALLLGLAVLLTLGEWALVRALSADLQEELASSAANVGEDLLELLRREGLPPPPPGALDPNTQAHRILVVRADHTKPDPTATPDDGAMPPPSSPETGATAPSSDAQPDALSRSVVEQETITRDGKTYTATRRFNIKLEKGESGMLVVHGVAGNPALPLRTKGVEAAVRRFIRRLLLASLGLVAGAVLLGGLVLHRFTQPLQALATAARRVGEGDLGVAAPAAPGEVGEAVAAFNQMSRRLQELDAETRRLRDSEQLSELGEVGRGLAHSLRNPLNTLGLALDHLAGAAAGGEDPANAQEVAAAARRQIQRIDAALRGFLALSAAGTAVTEVDLAAVARDVALEALQSRPGGDAARVEVHADGPLPLRGVEAELRAALQALVVNAVEASPPGGTVDVTLDHAEDGSLRVTVDDSGPGIPDEVRPRLFTPHVTTKPAGAGVGLYLTHRLATTRYSGEVEVADRPAGGTRAILRLRDRDLASISHHDG